MNTNNGRQKMHDLRIRITESDGIRYHSGINSYASTLYVGDNIKDALDAMLEEMQGFAHHNPKTMVDALHFYPEFCQLAAAVHGLHLAESDETPTTEAIAILTKLRDSRQPEAIRTRAGNLLIDIAEDDHAVCDASSVDERPGQDAGAALVGVECYVWGNSTWGPSKVLGPVKIAEFSSLLDFGYRAGSLSAGCSWKHARPTYLGLPEATP